ncbi:MAG: hypothetical protein HY762_04730 [Planctomycetes bacterium]|nr:hypothetical protein [Planctomycetota bacterium]
MTHAGASTILYGYKAQFYTPAIQRDSAAAPQADRCPGPALPLGHGTEGLH